ncbi:MAG: hypothetical protein M2R45_01617 [Verrucomicrobia subdivision 3 bacterium]|nr:hypothetical protein [Limisphaerales bacterium]MCS1412769.1 hypothetical protein [Limisphaerales bacterium]
MGILTLSRTLFLRNSGQLAVQGGGQSRVSNSAFPDIAVNGFGVEVKFTKRASGHATGNSIFEGMRDESARQVYLVYCRADRLEIRWRPYEDCIKGVRILHSTRYTVGMDGDG